jgi:hypothetical protein
VRLSVKESRISPTTPTNSTGNPGTEPHHSFALKLAFDP